MANNTRADAGAANLAGVAHFQHVRHIQTVLRKHVG